MKYVYVCPKCKAVYAKVSDQPDGTVSCSGCNVKTVYLKCTKEEWDQKTPLEKLETKEDVIEHNVQESINPNNALLEKIGKIESHLSVIKGILVFFTVLSVLGGLIMLINLM